MTPTLAVEGLVGSHSLHLWCCVRSQTGTGTGLGETEWGADSGKRLFAYQRVIVNAINCRHLCLHKINRNPSPSHPSGVLISVILAVPGCKVRLGACSFTGKGLSLISLCTDWIQPALSSTLQLGTHLPRLFPSPGVEPCRDEDLGLKELTDPGTGA